MRLQGKFLQERKVTIRCSDHEELQHAESLAKAFRVFVNRSAQYGDAWRKGGTLGALAKARTKVDRQEAVCEQWDEGIEGIDTDDCLDLVNYAVFAMRSIEEGNIEGTASLPSSSFCGSTSDFTSYVAQCILNQGHEGSHIGRNLLGNPIDWSS